ncbi:MAG: SIS domain-containing protein [Chloroflexi bacterium]|nr:SIS domain-containing protein [Chloroflexota bacterium]
MLHNRSYIDSYLDDMEKVVRSLPRTDIDRAIELLFSAWQRGATTFIIGNGGSASTATHFACDLQKCTIVDGKKRFKAFCLNDNVPLVSAWTNDSGFENLYSEQLRNFLRSGDVVIALSVHGGVGQDKGGPWSQNLLKAVALAKDMGAHTIGFSGFDGGALRDVAEVCVTVPVNSTPQVESFHLALEHLVTFCLREKILASQKEDANE